MFQILLQFIDFVEFNLYQRDPLPSNFKGFKPLNYMYLSELV